MKKRTTKARKKHECAYCLEPIAKGEDYLLEEWRQARVDENENQIGVEFMRFRFHIGYCGDMVDPATCAHEWKDDYEQDGYAGYWRVYAPTGKEYCERCGLERQKGEH